MTVNNDIDDDSATKHDDSHTMHTSLPGSPPLSSKVGSPGSGHDLDGMASRSTDEQLMEKNCCCHSYLLPITKTTSRPSPTLWSFSHPGKPTLNRSSTPFLPRWPQWNRITAPSLRLCKLEGDMVSASSVSGSARSWNVLARSHGPRSSDDNRNTRRRLDALSSPEDEQPRSAVLLQFPCEQHHKGKQSGSMTLGNSLQSKFRVSQVCS